MLISLNAIKRYVNIPDSISNSDLMKLIGPRLVEVEGTESLAEKYQNIYIAKVVKCTDIEGTHLHLCEIDAGIRNAEFSTLESGLIQVVCGAPNVRAGILVAWLAPGAIVPSTFGTENFQLSVRKLRGYESYGMIAGPDELGFGNEHKYIAEIAPDLANPGDTFSSVFGLDDLIIDIENKSLTHRPDTFGIIGFAREVAGILGQKFDEPTIYQGDFRSQAEVFSRKNTELSIEIADPKLCPRYSCVVLGQSDFIKEPTPEVPDNRPLTKDSIFLYKAGMRPVSQIVDATNLTMLETGQPLHAFDYDKFIAVGGSDQPKILVRRAKEGEKLTLLDDTVVDLNENDIVITSNDIPVALAGAMGGKNTEIDENTKRILLESATFSLYNLRKTQMAHGIFSEAITRFTKGQPAFGTVPALELCLEKLGVKNLDQVAFADQNSVENQPNSDKSLIVISLSDLNQTLGANFTVTEVKQTLENVGFIVDANAEQLVVQAPLWRTDIHIKEDIYEEMGRLTGFDNIPKTLPTRSFKGSPKNPLFALKSEIRNTLSDVIGGSELLTYSFVSKALQQKVGENIEDSYEIVNSISPELQCFRQSIIPSLLEKTYENQKAGFKDFVLYEMNQVAKKSFGMQPDQTPSLESHLAICLEGDYYQIKQICETLGRRLGFDFKFTDFKSAQYPYFESLHSVDIKVGQTVIGALGEIKHTVLKGMKLKNIAALEINLVPLLSLTPILRGAQKISRFPSVTRDLTVKTPDQVSFAILNQTIEKALKRDNFVYEIEPVSIYRQTENSETRNCSFHLSFASTVKTMSADEISDIMKQIAQNITELGAEII
jgi:phenylalanine--tRNA ligase, beta subunit